MDKLAFSFQKHSPERINGGVIFMIPAFKTKSWHYKPLINTLTKAGFTVYAYSYESKYFMEVAPTQLAQFSIDVVEHIKSMVASEFSEHPGSRFGVIGVSAGSMVALHAAKKCTDIEKIMLITVHGVTSQDVWEHSSLKKMRKTFESLNLGPLEVYEKLGYLEPTYRLDLVGKREVLVYVNPNDPVIRYDNTKILIEAAEKQSINLTIRNVRARRHSLTIIKAFQDKQHWLKFFNSLTSKESKPDQTESL